MSGFIVKEKTFKQEVETLDCCSLAVKCTKQQSECCTYV